MTTPVPTKIVLKSTTKMSLNDRFTNIQKSRPQPAPSPQNIRSNIAQQQQASAKNRRLAQQLANRPGMNNSANSLSDNDGMGNRLGVVAAMRIKKRNLQQRLGRGNIKARLNLAAVGRGGDQIGGRGMQRGFGMRRGRGAQRGWFKPGGDAGFVQPRGRGFARGQGQRGGFRNTRGRGMRRGGGDFRGGRGMTFTRFRGGRGRPRGRGPAGRGGQRGRGARGRGGRGGRGAANQVSREELDNQLEEYMSKTKNHLDHELDAYMAEANPS